MHNCCLPFVCYVYAILIFFAISYLPPASSNPSANFCHFLIMPFPCSCTFCSPEHVAPTTCGGRISSISLFMKPLTCIHKVNQLQERSKAVASLSLSGGQDKNISSFFPHFPVVSLIFPQIFLNFFLILVFRVGGSPTATLEGPGYTTGKKWDNVTFGKLIPG